MALMLMCILPLATILFYNLYVLRQSQERRVHDDGYRLGQVASLEMARIIGGVEDILLAVAATPVVRNGDTEACTAYMARVTESLPQFSGIAVLDPKGVIWCLKTTKGIGVSLADKAYFRESLTLGKTVLGRFTKGRITGQLILPVAVPIRDPQGAVVGVVAGSLSLDWLQKRITERRFAAKSSLTVADGDGTIVARYPEPEKFIGTRIPDQYRKLVTAAAPGTIEVTSQDGTQRILAYFPATEPSKGLYVSVGLSTEEEFGAIYRALIWSLTVTLAACAAAMILAWLTAKYSIGRPVEKLVATVENWRNGRQDARTGFTDADGEFGVVGRAIDVYMDELVAARGRSEFMMRELDHRVKNLLATVQVVARQSLRGANLDPAILKALLARLSAMSEAHSILMKDESHAASFREVVATAIRPFDSPDASPFRTGGPNFTVGSSAALAFSMSLHELCTNAAKYGALSADGLVTIGWRIEESPSGKVLNFSWTESGGPGCSVPSSNGFGTLLIQRMLADQLRGALRVEYAAHGLELSFIVPMENLRPQAIDPPEDVAS
jgi:two-component sensor histidine kinase